MSESQDKSRKKRIPSGTLKAKSVSGNKRTSASSGSHELFLSAINQPVIIENIKGNVEYLNKAAEEFCHALVYKSESQLLPAYSPENHLINWEKAAAQNSVSQQAFRDREKMLKTGKELVYQLELKQKDEKNIFVRVNESILKGSNNERKGTIKIISDITAEKKAANKLSESNKRMKTAMQAADEGEWEYYPETDIFRLDDNILQLLGYDPEYAVHPGYLILDHIHPDQRMDMYNNFEDFLSGRTDNFIKDFKVMKADGNYKWVCCHATLIPRDNQDMPPLMIGIIRDISQRKKMEFELDKKEKKLRFINNNVHDIIWQMDKDFIFTYVSPSVKRIMGYEPEEITGTCITEYLSGDFLRKHSHILQKILTDRGKSVHNYIDYEMKARNGKSIFLEVSSNPLYDAHGNITGFAGISRDITTRKKVERALHESETKYKTLVKNVNTLICEIDANGYFIFVNDMYEKVLGFKTDELLGRASSDLIHPEDKKAAEEKYEMLLKNGKSSTDVWRFKDKKGAYHIFECNSATYRDENKEIHTVVISTDITQRIKTEVDLNNSRNNLMRAEDVAGFGHWELDVKKNTISGSRGAAKIYGVEKKDFCFKVIQSIPLPEYKEILDNALMDLTKQHKPYDVEFRIKRPDNGELRDIHSVAEYDPRSGKVFGIINDITGRKSVERILSEKEEKLRMTVNASKLGLYDVDVQSNISTVNPEYALMLGYDPAGFEMNKEQFENFLHPDDRDRIIKQYENYVKGEADEYKAEFRMKNADGKYRWILSQGEVVEYDQNGNAKRMLGTHMDITDLKEYEIELEKKNQEIALQNQEYIFLYEKLKSFLEEIRETNMKLEKAKEKAEESDRLKSAFLANMSHEIRTPMNSILGFSELLAVKKLSEEKRQKYLNLIHHSGEQLMRLINDIIDISKIESNQLEVEKKWFDVNILLEEILAVAKQSKIYEIKENVKLELLKMNGKQPRLIFTDPYRLKQILDNLINNAIKFTDKGYVQAGYKIKKNVIEFFVKDTGTGISERNQKEIFKRFVQADNIYQKSGTGLGLSISKGLAELLGGKIRLESKTGKGSCFYVELPVE